LCNDIVLSFFLNLYNSDEKEKEKLESNAFYKLENDITNKKKTDESIPILTQLQVNIKI